MKHFVLALAATASLAACATGPSLSDTERLSLYREHAGEPVKSFRYTSTLMGWTPLGDSAIAVQTRPTQAYLLELGGPCPNLEFAHGITITNQFGSVQSRFDDVVPLGSGPMQIPCRIEEIRPVDVKALEAAEDRMREQVEMVERGQADGGT